MTLERRTFESILCLLGDDMVVSSRLLAESSCFCGNFLLIFYKSTFFEVVPSLVVIPPASAMSRLPGHHWNLGNIQ